MNSKSDRFKHLTYDDFRHLADDESLSLNEKIGFPDSYRAGKEKAIVEDIRSALPSLDSSRKTVIDIGPGCSQVATILQDHCIQRNHRLILVDCAEMLNRLADLPGQLKVIGPFPQCANALKQFAGQVDAILMYSVLHHIWLDSNPFDAIDAALDLLAPGGEMLIGDIPNESKRSRFFASQRGIDFHRKFTRTDSTPELRPIERGRIDDGALLGILARARNQGHEAFLRPQRNDLPMANRREDILIRKN